MVKIAGVGVCHTDLVFSAGQRPYLWPAVLGHEGAGTVMHVGPGVEDFASGDKVIIGFSSCGDCRRCREQLPSYCRDLAALNFAGGRTDGSSSLRAGEERVSSHFFGQSSFASQAVTRARNLVKVPETDLPLELLGPLGCGFQTGAGAVMRALRVMPGSTMVVIGGGSVGMAAVMAGGVQQCSGIVLVEPMAARRALALEVGASAVIDPTVGNVAEQILSVLPDGADFAVDTTGRPDMIEAALASLGTYGALALLGLPGDPAAAIPLKIGATMLRGQRIVGVVEGESDQQRFIPELIAHQRAGRFPFEKLIRTFPLASINEAIAAQHRGECVKAVLIPAHADV